MRTKIPGKLLSPGIKNYITYLGKDDSLCLETLFNFGQTPPAKGHTTCVIPDNAIGNLSKIVFP